MKYDTPAKKKYSFLDSWLIVLTCSRESRNATCDKSWRLLFSRNRRHFYLPGASLDPHNLADPTRSVFAVIAAVGLMVDGVHRTTAYRYNFLKGKF